MSSLEDGEVAPDVTAIGISFGNSYSSIAYTNSVSSCVCECTPLVKNADRVINRRADPKS